MARLIAVLIGLGFVFVSTFSFITGFVTFLGAEPDESGSHAGLHPREDIHFSFDGPFGTFDRQQLQRGFQVYRDVCAGCHGINLVAFRNLEDLGYSEAEVRAIANEWPLKVPTINPQDGAATERNALPSDYFPNPYPNEVAARAGNNNALPPDLSLIVKAREGGAHYIASLLAGYQQPPADHATPPGLHYNPYFANQDIAMPPPLADGQVTYADGTTASVDQMSQDVAAFLAWTAEPHLETRRRWGLAVVPFLLIATILAYFAYRSVWADRKPKKRKAA